MIDETPQSLGGKARADKLSPEDRSKIAKEAAERRWAEKAAPAAAFGAPDKPIRIADIEVPCYVLDDGRRVIPTNGMLDTLTMARGGAMVRGMNRLELFVSMARIKPFVSNDLHERIRRAQRHWI